MQSRLENVGNGLRVAEGELEELLDGMNLQTMYSNSIDFGDYDYSGNPNLMRIVKASDFHLEGDTVVTDVSTNAIYVMSKGAERLSTFTSNNTPSLISGKTYTISAKVKVDEGTTGDIDKIRIAYRKTTNGTILLSTTAYEIEVGKEITVKATGVVNYEITDLSRFYLTIDLEGYSSRINGGVIISDIKIEEGPTATPYQPNLLDEPYYLSKIPLGENIANKSVAFPIKSSAYSLYQADMEEEFIVGQTYTLTMKATKPAIQTFIVYNESSGDYRYGNLEPVEGLVDTWGLTFTPQKLGVNYPKRLTVIQYPQSTTGACQIDWLKIEKGNTRTPNTSQLKYFGEGLKDSNNPNDYSWDVTPEYTEKSLNNTVSLTEPQSIEGLKNFEDGLQIAGKEVATITDLDKTAITTINNKDGEIADFNLNGAVFGFGSEIKTTGTKAAFKRNSDKKLVCQIAGTYIFNGQLSVQVRTAIDAWHYVDMRVNGTTAGSPWARGVQSFRNRWNFSGMLQVSLKVGDVIDFVSISSETGATTGQFISCPLAVFQRIGD
ncbi:hypothetical protein RRS09_001676 [Enterococcus faecium]|uniref:hypothetical protein n=2 Tax=Enterococcus faecium TaxID=1352 RepID=UPI000B756506|nr:hypothetical protein [Enterococcus faecium]EJF8929037.1 hypothetical protein [Enterococcus faecium]EKA3136833.1 hypothetical protein [Enterococcus faecium]ELI7154664.1 hypothetical protein [Enterococcus faecium]EMC2434163.1 hypothetical protein [Enterococcus faecium]OTO46121.1 hypothetical protein A5841_000991 [Enterococcus faecium]